MKSVMSIVCVVVVLALTSMAGAAILSDDFESGVSGTPLFGQTADTGQTYYMGWGTAPGDSLVYNPVNATGGTLGAGTNHSWAGHNVAADFAQQSTGILRVSADLMEIAAGGEWNGGAGGCGIMLRDSVAGTTLEIVLSVPNGVGVGNLVSSGNQAYLGDGLGTEYFSVMGGASVVVDVDLDNKLVDFAWDGFTTVTWATGLSGAVNDLSYAGTFNPDKLILYAYGGRSGLNWGGCDNLGIYEVDCDYNISEGLHITGDINNDCYVDMKDLVILTENWITCNHPMDASCD